MSSPFSLLDLLAGERGHELVAAHPDVAVDAPDREQDLVLAEGAVPGDRVLVVRVDERAVDVEDGGGRHPRCVPTRGPPRKRASYRRPARSANRPLKLRPRDTDEMCACASPSQSRSSRPSSPLLMVAAPTASAAGCNGAGASASQVSKRTLVRATLCVLNHQRRKHGLRPLRLDKRLSRAARMHSAAMARHSFFSHDSPNGSTSWIASARPATSAAPATGTSARTSPGAPAASRATRRSPRAWMNSPGHRANILSRSFGAIGIGDRPRHPGRGRGATYTTDFGRRGVRR